MDFTVWYGNSYYTTDRANIKIEMIDNFGGSTILHNQGYYKNLYTNPATFASKSVNNIVAAYDGYFRVTLMCSKGVAYFENLDIDIDRTETVVTNTIETDVLNSSDYYPFGLRMVKNSAPSVNYPYGYQGDFAEEDDETGFNHFEARAYDPVIGRWMNVDPAGQFWSPYVGMGNAPTIGVDPDGRDCPKCPNGKGYDDYRNSTLYYDWSKQVSGDGAFLWHPSATISAGLPESSARARRAGHLLGIYQGQADFVRGSAELAAYTFGEVGNLVTYAGYGTSLIPGAQPIAGLLYTTGTVLATASAGINLGINIVDGDAEGAALTGATYAAGFFAVKSVSKLSKSGLITQIDQVILEGSVATKMAIMGMVISKTNE
jgi:RHS repeat-associated protein